MNSTARCARSASIAKAFDLLRAGFDRAAFRSGSARTRAPAEIAAASARHNQPEQHRQPQLVADGVPPAILMAARPRSTLQSVPTITADDLRDYTRRCSHAMS